MTRSVLGAIALVFGLVQIVTAQTIFTEAGGVVVIEAENFSNNTSRVINGTNFQWVATNTVSGFSGTGYMEATPNVGENQSVTWSNTSPELDYPVNFNLGVIHYVLVRAFAFTNTDDSVHAGLNGATNTAFGISLGDAQTNFWAWTTNRITGVSNRATISVSTGTQTFNLWMREDGMRVDRIILTTNINFQTILGNVFHIPSGIEVGSGNTTMRSPVDAILSNTPVFLYTGNQFQGAGNPGNQLATGSTIFYRNATNSTWTSVPMAFWYTGGASGNNKYYSNSIPANLFSAGDTVQYYFKIPYSDHLPTFVGGNNTKYELEADARAGPFSYTVQGPLTSPSGPYVAFSNVVGSIVYEARVYQNSGQITLSGPDLAGNPLANTITVEPPAAMVNGNNITLGAVLSSTPLSNGIQLVEAFGSTSAVVQVTFSGDGVMHYEVIDWGAQVLTATTVTVPSDSSEHFYGFGEKFNALDQAGKKVHMLTRDIAGDKGDNSYKVAPWFISTKGYGFHLDSTDESWFDMRNGFSDRYVINNMVASSFSGYVTNAVKYNIVYGPRLPDVLTRYTSYTGRPSLPPKWAFAPWMSSDVWHTGGEVRYTISKYRALGIPGSAFVFDSPWEVGYNDFTWNTSQWGDSGVYSNINGGGSSNYLGFTSITDMMTFIRTNGFYAVCWMTPFVNINSVNPEGVSGLNIGQAANYAEGAASNYFVRASSGGPPLVVPWWKGNGSPIDFTNPSARLWAQKQLSNLVAQSQSGGFNVIGGFKTDDGETDNGGNTYIPTTAVYSDGRTGIEMRNGFCVEYHKSIWNVLGTNGLLFARSGFTGSQAYPGYWAGDNQPNFGDANGLPGVVIAGLSSAMSGFSMWASDLGGYQNSNFGSTPDNLFMRWTQFGAFSPLMQMHRQVDVSNLRQFPWGYSADALTNYLFYAKLRTALFPYIYSYALESSTNGLPIMRPLVLMYQTDPNTYGSVYNTSHSYLFGNELLVAPAITNTVTTRSVYLPQGNWYDFFSNMKYSGAQSIIWSNTNQSQMPLFVREGAIIPMISTNVMTLCDSNYVANPNLATMGTALEFLIYPGTNSSFTLYDGTSLVCQSNGIVVVANLTSIARPVTLRFHGSPAAGVEQDGMPLMSFTNVNGFVEVSLNHTGGTTQIAVTIDTNVQQTAGNVFHIPNNLDADVDLTMRNPQSAILPATRVELYTANQFQGAGNPGNQLQIGSTIFFKHATNATWSSVPMFFQKIGTSNPNYKYYSNSIPPNVFQAGDVVQYYFAIPYSDHLTTYLYGNDTQSFTATNEVTAQANPFSYTVAAPPASVTPSPADWRDLNIYQILTDRFFDGDPSNNNANPYGTFNPAGGSAIHGGDFKGLQQKLDYIKTLGANAIWISPVLLNPYGEYHGYLTVDPYQIDPHWGTFDDMTNMIAAAHARGIYVIVDVICNHPGDLLYSTDSQFLTTFRAPPNGYTLQWRDPARQYAAPWDAPVISSLFHTNGLIQDFNNTQQVELGELRNLDDFRTELTHVRTNMANIYQYWIGRADWDGFRVDTVKHVEQGFWQFWSPQIHQYAAAIGKSNLFMFGETVTGDDTFNGSYTGTKGGGNFELDSMHDYPLYFKINSALAGSGNTKQIEDHYNDIAGNYDPGAEFRLNTFLDNHDNSRFLSVAGNNTNRLTVALGFLYTSRGIPSLYYGTEQAFNGVKDSNNSQREDMFDGAFATSGPALGDNFNETHPLFRYVAMLSNFRRNYISLRRGGHRNLWNDPSGPGLFAYSRTNGNEEVFVAFNTGATQSLAARPTSYSNGTVVVNLFNTNETLTVSGGNIPSMAVTGTTIKMFIAQSLWKPLDPVVVSQSPAHGATNVPPTTPLVLTFSKPMDTNSVQITGTWSGQTQLTVNAVWPLGATNVVSIGTNATDAVDGKSFFAPYESYFVTSATAGGDSNSPSVTISSPIDGAKITGDLNIAGTATDDAGVAKVEVSIDGGNWFSATGTTNWNLTFDTGNLLNGTHSILARATDTAGNSSGIASNSVWFINVPSSFILRISPGNALDVTNCDSAVWLKDRAYTLGSFGFVGGAPSLMSGNFITSICNEGQVLYRRARESLNSSTAFSYQFDCPEGVYETTLLFSETYTNVANARRFNVFIQGQQVLTNFDLFAASGNQQNIPVSRVFTNTLASTLVLQFAPVNYLARASGIQVRRIADVFSDNDEIPDWWRRAYFGHPTGLASDSSRGSDDADGDGFSNLQEYLAGTSPLDANSALAITKIEVVGIDMQVSWRSSVNKTNQLERSATPNSNGTWQSVGLTMPGTGSIVMQPDPGAATNAAPQFYRVRLIP